MFVVDKQIIWSPKVPSRRRDIRGVRHNVWAKVAVREAVALHVADAEGLAIGGTAVKRDLRATFRTEGTFDEAAVQASFDTAYKRLVAEFRANRKRVRFT